VRQQKPPAAVPHRVINLMAALRQSIAAGQEATIF